jgi:hypothetical protein
MLNLVFPIPYDLEIFRPIPGHRQYIINQDGTQILRIVDVSHRNYGKSIVIRDHLNTNGLPSGYKVCTLLSNDKLSNTTGKIYDSPFYKSIGVHRLVAFAWIGPEPEGMPWVNHEDGIKSNNLYTNLKWSTIKENIQHSYDVLKRVTKKGKDHWLYGKKAKKKTKLLQSAAKKGINHPKFTGYYITPAGKFTNLIDASKANKTHIHNITKWCKNIITEGYSFEPIAS